MSTVLSNETKTFDSFGDLLSYWAREEAIYILVSIIQPPFLITGVVTNLISIATFLKLGIHQSITACFFMLSCSDLAALMFAIPATSFTNVQTVAAKEGYEVDGKAVALNLICYYFVFFDTSQMLTAFIAVQRSCCVAQPFKFKNTFTRCRVLLVAAMIFVYCLSTYTPVILSQGLVSVFDDAKNMTSLTFWAAQNRQTYVSMVDNISGIGLTTVCQVTIIICLLIMAVSFRASSKFRKSMVTWNEPEDKSKKREKISRLGEKLAHRQLGPRREVQALQITTVVSMIFVLCNTPKVILAYSFMAVPDLGLYRRFENLYYVVNILRNSIEYINTSLNMFVYLKFNTRYRKTILAFFQWQEKAGKQVTG